VLLFIITSFILVAPVAALTEEQRSLFNSGIFWFNAEESQCGSATGATLQGNNNAEKAFNYFVANSFSAEQSAGIVGNLQVESGVDPTRVRGQPVGTDPNAPVSGVATKGIAQWEGGRLSRLISYAEARGEDPYTLELQLDFIMFEFTGSPSAASQVGGGEGVAYNDLKSQTTVEESAVSFSREYERNALSLVYVSGVPGFGITTLPTYEEAYGYRIAPAEEAFIAFASNSAASYVNCTSEGENFSSFYAANPGVTVEPAEGCGAGEQPGAITLNRWSR